jgi:multiple sugar transport system ATP-binding protein
MSAVVLDDVSKHFGDVVAVDHLSLEIIDREFMVLLGPSGCGKTTVLRMIAGLDSVTDGTLHIGDRIVNHIEAKDRNVSMVFQSYALYPHMTVHKNIESPLLARKFHVDEPESRPGGDGRDGSGNHGSGNGNGNGGAHHREPRRLTKSERDERIAEAEHILGLTELSNRKPGALSGGQRQRVALARAIVGRPEVFLFDEPLSNLDAKLRAQTRLELVDLHRRLETTFVYVTHDQVEAMTMATRIAILNEGRLQQVGAPEAIYERPHNLFVARFIGSPPMNTVRGKVVVDEGEPFIDVGAGRFPIGGLRAEPMVDGATVVVGVRPEDLVIDDGPVEAVVEAVEWLGHERHVVCTMGDEAIVVRESTNRPGAGPGDTVRMSADPAQLHLFDPNTTERLN